MGNESPVNDKTEESETMKDQEILAKRAELHAESEAIWDEWQAYDKRYPVLPGAYKPPDYDSQQRAFSARLRAVSDERRALPRTTGEKLRQVFTWFLIVAALVAVVFVLF
jgi:hypothetical protein